MAGVVLIAIALFAFAGDACPSGDCDGQMPDRLSFVSSLLLVALAFGLAFAIQAPLGGAEPAVKPNAPAVVANAPAAEPDLSLTTTATVPALRDARQPRKRHARRKKTLSVRIVKAAPKLVAAPVLIATPTPTPTAIPRFMAPAPRRSTPAPKPKPAAPKPAPTPMPEPSGEFDSSSES